MMEGEKQGKLGDLEKMTLPQLQELLDRQEKLLSRRKFLQTLPDGGQKVTDFAVRLQDIIARRQEGCLTQANTALLADRQTMSCPLRYSDSSLPPESNRDPLGNGEGTDSTTALTDAIDSMVISELAAPRMTDKCSDRSTDGGNLETRFPNSYEAIMKKDRTPGKKRELFRPNRSLKISDIRELPDAYKLKSRSSASTTPTINQSADSSRTVDQSADSSGLVDQSSASVVGGRKKGGGVMVPEDGAVPGPRYRFQGAKVVPLHESLALQRQQREQLEKLQTLHAAERLAERLNLKTGDYAPPALDMQYRSNSAADDGDANDSDDNDDNDEDDVPD